MSRKKLLISFLALAAGCGGKVERTDAKLQAELDLASFPSTPVAVESISEEGVVARSSVGASGAFALGLPGGHSYRISIVLTSGSVPLVFPRSPEQQRGFVQQAPMLPDRDLRVDQGGALRGLVPHTTLLLDRDFRVEQGGAVLWLGTIHYQGSAPETGFAPHTDASLSCEGDDDVEYEYEGEDDGECENGTCTDLPDELADPSQPMAVGDYNVPNEVGGCDDEHDGEEEDDD